jgi:hypothetical protein
MSSDATASPSLIAACDWSAADDKRWMATAVRENGHYYLFPPEPVGPVSKLLADLKDRAGTGGVLAGFDFPIGLPRAYAEQAGIRSFLQALPCFGSADWADFYTVATTPEQIELHRPFYPPPSSIRGERSKLSLGKLTAGDLNGLLRRCDRATISRPAASELFWTIGARQVGRAAITGWRDLLTPSLNEISIWPFVQTSWQDLLKAGSTVVAEIYPAEACHRVGVRFGPGLGKSSQSGRRACSATLQRWCRENPVRPSEKLLAMIDDGFGNSSFGGDMFDAVVGLFGMIKVVKGLPAGAPEEDEAVRTLEGWILGLQHEDVS